MAPLLKPEILAAARAQLFRTASSAGSTDGDTEHIALPLGKKKKHHRGKPGEAWTIYAVSISLPFGGTRRYVTSCSTGGGMALAISKAIGRDGRIGALEIQEMALIGVRKMESIEPPLLFGEVRLLLNTER